MKKGQCPEKVSLPNCITAVRIIGTVVLLFTAPLSVMFYVVYVLCGISDVLDGWVDRQSDKPHH